MFANNDLPKHNSRLARLRKTRLLAAGLLAFLGLAAVAGCERREPRKTDAELGLNPQQSRGRRVYDDYCLMCHEAYSSSARRGPTMQGLFKKPAMPSGTPANDERVSEVIMMGRAKMPAYSNRLSQQQLQDLLAYLHTL